MKKTTAITIWLLFGAIMNIYAQQDFKLTKYVMEHYIPKDSLKKSCGWSYTLVKMSLGQNNDVVKLDYFPGPNSDFSNTLNLNHSLDFMIGYHYANHQLHKRNILFYFSVVPDEACDVRRINSDPNDVIKSIFYVLKQAQYNDPTIEVLYDPVIIFPWSRIK